MAEQVKRNFKAIAADISEGFLAVNPIFLKPFNENALKVLYLTVERRHTEIRAEAFPYNNPELIRKRNLKLQRLHTALTVIKNFAREKKFALR
ncbi:MAG: hypothetical protein M1353_01160 [Nitrospirae bacterium]|nr:hypothetical protein [Nitrospirota bacterium]